MIDGQINSTNDLSQNNIKHHFNPLIIETPPKMNFLTSKTTDMRTEPPTKRTAFRILSSHSVRLSPSRGTLAGGLDCGYRQIHVGANGTSCRTWPTNFCLLINSVYSVNVLIGIFLGKKIRLTATNGINAKPPFLQYWLFTWSLISDFFFSPQPCHCKCTFIPISSELHLFAHSQYTKLLYWTGALDIPLVLCFCWSWGSWTISWRMPFPVNSFYKQEKIFPRSSSFSSPWNVCNPRVRSSAF